jgi:hypothetical protein
MNKWAIVGVALAIILAGLSYGAFRYFFEVIEVEEVVEGPIMYREPMAGIAQTFEKLGLPARVEKDAMTVEDVAALDITTAFVCYNRDYEMSQEKVETLLDWVAAGGTLIVPVENHYEFPGMDHMGPKDEDPMLAALGIHPDRSSDEWMEDPPPLIYQYRHNSQINVKTDTRFTFRFLNPDMELPPFGREISYEGQFGHTFWLQADHVINESGYSYINLHHGEGRIGVLIDCLIFHNRRITFERNSEFLLRIIAEPGFTKEVLFAHLSFPASFFSKLFGPGFLLGLGALISLLLWVWSVVPRNGPIQQEPPPERRSLSEHILASSRFLWNHHAEVALLEPTRSALMQRISETHAEWFMLPEHQRYRYLSDRSRLPMGTIANALSTTEDQLKNDPDTFFSVIASLEHIRRSL